MGKVTVKEGQSIFDICIQETGGISGVFDIAKDNAMDIDTPLFTGQLLDVKTEKENEVIWSSFEVKGITPTTSKAVEPSVGPPVVTAPTLTITVKNQDGDVIETANFGDVITIELTTSITTPTEHRFFINNQTFIQPSNTLSYTITSFDDITIHAEAEDGSAVAAALDATSITINADADANAFIADHNVVSGNTMAAHQQEITQGFFQRLKGTGTTYGENVWSVIHANPNSRMQILIPVSNSVANLSAYAIDCIHLGSGTYNGIVLSDYSPSGVGGGPGRYFDIGVAPNAFDQNSLSVHTYIREDVNGIVSAFGSSQSSGHASNSVLFWPKYSGSTYNQTNASGTDTVANTDSRGFWSLVRDGAAYQAIYKNGVLLDSTTIASTTPSDKNMYFHAMNKGGALSFPYSAILSFYAQLPALTANQVSDLYEAVQWLQTNIITGGRDV